MNKQGNKTKQNLSRRIKRKWNGVVGNKKSSSSYIFYSFAQEDWQVGANIGL